ncbi:MAG: hypothetical protein AAGA77_07705 [Bacteroidota bacterium]
MSKLKSILKWLLIVILFVVIALFVAVKVMSEKRPEAIQGENADALAQSMLEALNKPAWDTLKYLKWEFRGGHRYIWDKRGNKAIVDWDDYRVLLDLDKIDGVALKGAMKVPKDQKEELIKKAWAMWCNDSFWMFAPFKVFDPGTSRSVVKTQDGQKGLMVSYESGGVTPGDGYLWLLDERNIPTGYKMWTSIIPIKGMYMSWENWQTLNGGAKVAIDHKSKLLSFDMKGVEEGDSPSAFGFANNVFDF